QAPDLEGLVGSPLGHDRRQGEAVLGAEAAPDEEIAVLAAPQGVAARPADEQVPAGPPLEPGAAAPAQQRVVAHAAEQGVGAAAALQPIVPGTVLDGDRHLDLLTHTDPVVAAAQADLDAADVSHPERHGPAAVPQKAGVDPQATR